MQHNSFLLIEPFKWKDKVFNYYVFPPSAGIYICVCVCVCVCLPVGECVVCFVQGQVIIHLIKAAIIVVCSANKWQNSPCVIIAKKTWGEGNDCWWLSGCVRGAYPRAAIHLHPCPTFDNSETHSRHLLTRLVWHWFRLRAAKKWCLYAEVNSGGWWPHLSEKWCLILWKERAEWECGGTLLWNRCNIWCNIFVFYEIQKSGFKTYQFKYLKKLYFDALATTWNLKSNSEKYELSISATYLLTGVTEWPFGLLTSDIRLKIREINESAVISCSPQKFEKLLKGKGPIASQ